MTAYPPVVVVDEQDNPVGSAMLVEVWQKGLYHRIVSIFVLDDQGRMLLQLRTPNVAVYPNCWDQAAGGHVDEGYSYNQTAANELAEEIGLHDLSLTTVATYLHRSKDEGRTINQFVRVYTVTVPHDIVLQPDAHEVSQLQWFTPAQLQAQIAEKPATFTPGFLHELHHYFPTFCEQT